MDRRDFLKISGAGLAGAVLDSCANHSGTNAAGAPDAGTAGMEYRINNRNGDKVSLLGYGCMR